MANINTPNSAPPSGTPQPPQLTNAQLAQACSNYYALLKKTPDSKRFPRVMDFDKASLQRIIDSAPGSVIRVYYGLLDETMGEGLAGTHILFMAPAVPKGMLPLNFVVVVPGCIGERPPCSLSTDPPSDTFIQ